MSSRAFRSTSPNRISSRSCEASAMTRPKGSQKNDAPQNSSPWPVADVHLAVEAAESAVGIENGGGVVVDAGGTFLEERCDQDNIMLAGGGGEFFASGAGDGFSEIEEGVVFALAEVLSLKEFWKAD